jgi:hypothetical protein
MVVGHMLTEIKSWVCFEMLTFKCVFRYVELVIELLMRWLGWCFIVLKGAAYLKLPC